MKARILFLLLVTATGLMGQTNEAQTGRFVRGTGTNAHSHSWVIPLSQTKGVAYDLIGGSITNWYPGHPWTNTYYHYNATNTGQQYWVSNPGVQPFTTNRIAFQNPIVAFGSTPGGSPLYPGQQYSFGIYSGDPWLFEQYLPDSIRVEVYARSNFASLGRIDIRVPNFYEPSQLTPYATNGFTYTTNRLGLTTTLSEHPYVDWPIGGGLFTYVLTHTAGPEATNYIYKVIYAGYGGSVGQHTMVLDDDGFDDFCDMYTLDFEARRPLRPLFVDQPHFQGEPLPPAYVGKSLAELTNVTATLPPLTNLTSGSYLTLNHSPELRRHPILDQFVQDMRHDPLALANYVINQIGLTDTIDLDTNHNSSGVINLGGVKRNALATFQEGQGSPSEQCALLVYLLREAGVPATYLYPTNNGLKMLDAQMSKLMGVQLNGAVNYKSEEFIPYPLQNLAQGKATAQSSTNSGGIPSRAVDGNTDGVFSGNSVTATSSEANPWWQVDLGQSVPIGNLEIWNRTDCCGSSLANFYLLVSDVPFGSATLASLLTSTNVWQYHHAGSAGVSNNIPVNRVGRYVRVQLAGTDALSLAEVKVMSSSSLSVLSVNYPWVAAYVNNQWVHIFPWLKDMEVSEGLNLYSYMPTNYNSGHKWVEKYLLGDPAITNLSQSDQVADLFPLFISETMKTNHPGISLDDVGVKIVNRQRLYHDWSQFPRPFALTGDPVVVENLGSIANAFDTIQIRVYSQANPAKYVDTGELLVADLHNRKTQVRFTKTGSNLHDMTLSVAPYVSGTTNSSAFTGSPTNKLTGTAALNSTDDLIGVKVTHRRLKFLPGGYATSNFVLNAWQYYYSENGTVTDGLVFETEQFYRKGDLITFCMHVGRVSERMLNVHAEEIWRHNQNAGTATDLEVVQGTTTYLMGMTYYHQSVKFRERAARLHKMAPLSMLNWGFALLRPQRSGDALPNNGDVIPVTPAVDMPHLGLSFVFNGTLHPDSGRDLYSAYWDYQLLVGAQVSAGEHAVIESFFHTNAFSTVKLLHLAGGGNVLRLDKGNYTTYGNTTYGGIQLKNHDADLWTELVRHFTNGGVVLTSHRYAFVTPGKVTNGTYSGMGMFLVDFAGTQSLISGFLNGGEGFALPQNTYTEANAVNVSVGLNPPGSFSPYYLLTQPLAEVVTPVFSAPAVWQQETTYQAITVSDAYLDPALLLATSLANQVNGIIEGSAADGFRMVYDYGLVGSTLTDARNSMVYLADPVNSMTGEFYVDTTDLTLPGPMPLVVRRNYSSQNLAENQFGFGWKLAYMPFLTVSDDGDLIYAADPDGSVLVYARTGTNANVWLPDPSVNPHVSNQTIKGLGSTSNPFNSRIDYGNDGGTNIYQLSTANGHVRRFDVRSYPLGGTFARQRPYLTTWRDSRGNHYSFEYGEDNTKPDYGQVRRVQSSNGSFLGFYYDVYGHIIEAYAGDGRRLKYEYDQYGDLVKVTLPDQSQVSYEYGHSTVEVNDVTSAYSTHLIVQESRPDGRVLQNEYDHERRVTNQLATVGLDLNPVRNATFIYSNDFSLTNAITNRVSGHTLVVDVFNRTNRYDYTNSLMTKITDALGQTEEQDWYADAASAPGYPRGLWKRKDKRGLWSEFKYDGLGNVTNTVIWGDLTGEGGTQYATNTVTYNTNSLPTESIDGVGNRTRYTYSSAYPFLAEEVVRLAGATPVVTNRMAYHDVTNTVTLGGTTYSNVAFGLLHEQVRAYGSPDAATNLWTHDGRGFITQEVRFTGTGDPAVTNHLTYNDRGELSARVDGAGRAVVFNYDQMGRPNHREVYEAGQAVPVSWEYSYYNENGEPTWSDGPRFDPEDYVWRDYDGAGRKAVEIRWRSVAQTDGSGVMAAEGNDLFSVTQLEHDAFGNLTKVTDPRGNYVQRQFDAIGQLTNEVFYAASGSALSTNRYGYEAGGQISAITNALGGVTYRTYTTGGKLKHQQSADGSTNAWTYYLDGRPKRSVQSNGAYQETTYDDAARRVTRIFYTAVGTPLATNLTEFDRRGNVTVTTDAAGFSSTNRFDGLDRVKSWVGPQVAQSVLEGAPPSPGGTALTVQQAYTNYYDAAGVVMTNVNALGEKTITYTDALGRATRTEIRTAANILVRESTTTYAANHHGLTVTNGSGSAAIASSAFTDNDGRTVLSIHYPAANAWRYTVNDYDVAGNLVFTGGYSRTNDTVSQFTSVFFEYDGLNRLHEKTDRDGAVTSYSYDPAGNLTQQILPGGLQWLALYNSAGQMFTNWNASGGGSVVRANGYTYYSGGSPWAGLTATHTDARGVVRTSQYDDYLRPATNSYSGSLDEQNLSTIWKYDVRGLVTNVVEKFASTNTGPQVAVIRNYNAYGQVTLETSAFGSNVLNTAHNYDSAARRQSLSAGLFGYNFSWRADGKLMGVDTDRGDAIYGYDTSGWLTNRSAGGRNTKILTRDGMGRPLTLETKVNTVTKLSETLTYTGDGLIASHAIDRAGFLDARTYAYAALSRRLTTEMLDLDSSGGWTNTFTFDSGAGQGAGVLTRINQPGGADWSAHMDDHLRVDSETNNVVRRLAYGRVNMQPNFGFAALGIKLDDRPVSFLTLGNSDTNWPTRWQAQIELTPGTHTLSATAVHPSKLYTNTTSVTFTNAAVDQTTLSYYSEGQLTQRVWKNGAGETNRVQTFQWDAKGRLHRFTERDVNGDGHDWSAVYDSFGRRWQTRTVPTTNNVAITSQLKTFTQAYDPHGEFLEIGVYVDGRWSWKVHGPDMNGVYGGMNGLGGWDAVVTGPDAFYPLLSDARGNIWGAYDPEVSGVRWSDSLVTAYGSIAGHRPSSLGEGVSLWEAGAWRGRYPELSGLYNLGARYYDPVAGRFLSPDPLGHDSDPSLYAAFNGDPVNYFDYDGRVAVDTIHGNIDFSLNVLAGFGEVVSPLPEPYGFGQPETELGYYGRLGGRFVGGMWSSAELVAGILGMETGTGMMAGGLGLVPVTGGASLPAAAVGAGVTAAGAGLFYDGFRGLENLYKLDSVQKPNPSGGAYKHVEADGGEIHHTPADSVSPLSTGDGPGFRMEIPDHRQTASWGRSKEAQAYRQQQRELIEQGKFHEAQELDIKDVQSKFGNKYDQGIQEMLDYSKTIPKDKLKPKHTPKPQP